MSINCRSGGTSHQHETVAEVKACYGAGTPAAKVGPTDKQVKFLNSLMERQGLRASAGMAELDKRTASGLISALVGKFYVSPEVPPAGLEYGPAGNRDPEAPMPEIPDGYYATPSLTGNNDLDFWAVKAGRKAGIVFVNRVIGGRDETAIPRDSKKKVETERADRVTQRRALEAIVDFGVEKSNLLFGESIKYCRRCGIHLTDELSRSLGIGPDCRSK